MSKVDRAILAVVMLVFGVLGLVDLLAGNWGHAFLEGFMVLFAAAVALGLPMPKWWR